MMVLLALGCGAAYLLHRILDPVEMLQMSRRCFPAMFFDNIWPDDQKTLLGPLLHFMLHPSKQTLKESNEKLISKTGHDLMNWSIKNGYVKIIQTILKPEMDEKVTMNLVRKAIIEGTATVIKIMVMEARKQESLHEINQTNLNTLHVQLPKMRGWSKRAN